MISLYPTLRDLVNDRIKQGWLNGLDEGCGRWTHADRRWTSDGQDEDNSYRLSFDGRTGHYSFTVVLRPRHETGLGLVLEMLTDEQALDWLICQCQQAAR